MVSVFRKITNFQWHTLQKPFGPIWVTAQYSESTTTNLSGFTLALQDIVVEVSSPPPAARCSWATKASNVAWICGTVARVCGMVFDTTVQNLTCSSGCLWPWTTYGMGIHCVEWADVNCSCKTLFVGSCQVEPANAKSSDGDRTPWTPLRLLVTASHCDVFIPCKTSSK